MWRTSFILMLMSLGTVGWLVVELGLSPIAIGSDKKDAPEGVEALIQSLRNKEKYLGQREVELSEKERVLGEKEKILTEHAGREGEKNEIVSSQMEKYEKMIADLQTETKGKDQSIAECSEKLKKQEESLSALQGKVDSISKTGALGGDPAQSIDGMKKTIADLQADLEKKNKMLEIFWPPKAETVKQVYEKMEPKRASKIFDQMSMEIAAYILSTLKTKSSSDILSAMRPERARTITEKYLAKRTPAEVSKVNEVNPNENAKTAEGGEQ